MRWDPNKAEQATEELAQILFHTYWGNAPAFHREGMLVQEQWRTQAREALKFTLRYYIDEMDLTR